MHTQKNKGSKRISEELVYEVCSYIRVGAPSRIAASAAGISEMDYLLWMREGKSPHHYENCKDCDFALFYREITMAAAQNVAMFFAFIKNAASNGDWKASVWWLEKFGNLDEIDNLTDRNIVTFEEIEKMIDELDRREKSKNY